jgi:hypothetical protein
VGPPTSKSGSALLCIMGTLRLFPSSRDVRYVLLLPGVLASRCETNACFAVLKAQMSGLCARSPEPHALLASSYGSSVQVENFYRAKRTGWGFEGSKP